MKIIIGLFLIILSHKIFSQDFYLLTSLSEVDGNELRLKEIEEKLQQQLGDLTSLNLKIIHQAGPKDLYKVLSSSKTIGLIWISHSAKEKNISIGINSQMTILDKWGNNVKNFFSFTTPQLRYLGIVGCQSKEIINQFISEGIYRHRQELFIDSFHQKVSLFKGLNISLSHARQKLTLAADENLKGTPLTSDEDAPVVLIKGRPAFSGYLEFGNTLVAYYDDKNESWKIIKELDKVQWWAIHSKRNFKFIRDQKEPLPSSFLSIEKEALSIEISINSDSHLYPIGKKWRLFQSTAGLPYGSDIQRLYLY